MRNLNSFVPSIINSLVRLADRIGHILLILFDNRQRFVFRPAVDYHKLRRICQLWNNALQASLQRLCRIKCGYDD